MVIKHSIFFFLQKTPTIVRSIFNLIIERYIWKLQPNCFIDIKKVCLVLKFNAFNTDPLGSQVLAIQFYSHIYNIQTQDDSHVTSNKTDCIPDYNSIHSYRIHILNDKWITVYIRYWSINNCSPKYIMQSLLEIRNISN